MRDRLWRLACARTGSTAALALALCVAACGGTAPGGAPGGNPNPGPTATATPTPTPSPTPTGPFVAVNDGLVRTPAVVSTDSATYGLRKFQGIPTIARVGNRLWAAWVGDHLDRDEGSGNYIVLTYSDNSGTSWEREYYLLPASMTTDAAFDPKLWVAPDGKLWVMYTQAGNVPANSVLDGQMGTWVAVIGNPAEAVPNFEPGFWLSDGLPQKPFAYNGQYYYTIDYLPSNPPRFPARSGEHLFRLDWENRRAIYAVTLPRVPNSDFNEGQFVVRRDNSLIYQSRSLNGIYESRASPGLFNFSAPVQWTFYPSAASRHFLSRSPSGRLVSIFNQRADPLRRDMTIAISADDGQTWPISHLFDPAQQVSYPDAVWDPTGKTIYVIYDRSRMNRPSIWLAEIDEDSIVAGTHRVQLRVINQQPY